MKIKVSDLKKVVEYCERNKVLDVEVNTLDSLGCVELEFVDDDASNCQFKLFNPDALQNKKMRLTKDYVYKEKKKK